MQTVDYCFHHANEYMTKIVPLFSNHKNNSPQSVRSLHFTLPLLEFKGQMNQKIEIFSFVALPSPNTKKTILSEIWVKIFLPKPLKEDKRSKSEHFRRLHENVSEMAA